MRRLLTGVLLVCVAAGGCTSKKAGADVARRLQQLARSGAKATFRADFKYEIAGPVSTAAKTTMQIVQRPSRRVARIETTTEQANRPVVSWIADRDSESYACSTYAGGDVWCVQRPRDDDIVGYAQIDDPLRLAVTRGFASVRKAAPATVAGNSSECFDVVQKLHASPQPSPALRFDPSGWRYRLCYSPAGVPLRLQRSSLEAGGPPGASFLFEATSVSTQVSANDVELPGRVREPQQLISPTPTAAGRTPAR